MKNKIVVLSLLLLNCAQANAELSYMDEIRGDVIISGDVIIGLRRRSKNPHKDQHLVCNSIPLAISAGNIFLNYYGKKSEKLEKIIQYNAWYNRHQFIFVKGSSDIMEVNPDTNLRGALFAEVFEPGVFLVADSVVEKLSDAVIETEMGKSMAQVIPEQHHQFLKKNGKIFVSALAAQGVGTVAKGESLSENSKTFGKNAFIHLGSSGLEEYVINPKVDEFMGSEDSNTKECVKFAANGAALYGLHVGLKMLGA